MNEKGRSHSESAWVLAGLAIVFGVYLKTLCPTVGSGDAGELTTAAYTLGIAHPPGYPLYCWLGRLLILIVPWFRVAWRVNLLSSVMAVLTLAVFSWILKELMRKEATLPGSIFSVAMLLFALSREFWAQVLQAEVYMLNLFLMVILVAVLLRWNRGREIRWLFLASFLFGMASANHFSIVFLGIGSLYLLLTGGFFSWSSLKKWMVILGFFVLGLTPYLYLLIRSRLDPVIDWGNPENVKSFLAHITVAQYRGVLQSLTYSDFLAHLRFYFRLLWEQWPPVFLGFAPLGIFLLVKRRRRIMIFLLLVFAACVLLGSTYNIPDIEAYFLPSYFVVALLMGIGLIFVSQKILLALKRSRGLQNVFQIALLLIPLSLLWTNYRSNDLSHFYLVEEYGRNILLTPSPGAILITSGDNAAFPSVYLHAVENMRPDILLLNFGLNPERVGRIDEKRREAPILDAMIWKKEAVAQARDPVYLTKEHTDGLGLPFLQGIFAQPWGLTYRVQQRTDDAQTKEDIWKRYLRRDDQEGYRGFRSQMIRAEYHLDYGEDLKAKGDSLGAYMQFLQASQEMSGGKASLHNNLGIFFRRMGERQLAREEYERALAAREITDRDRANNYTNLGNLEREANNLDKAKYYYQRALTIDPKNPNTNYNWHLLSMNQYLQNNHFLEAAQELEVMIRLSPEDPTIYYNLGMIYAHRLGNQQRAKQVFEEYLRLDPRDPVGIQEVQRELAQLQQGENR